MEDDEIVALYWDRDERAIRATAERYETLLTALADRVLEDREDSRECVNDTYWRAWRSIPPHRPTHLGAYLSKLTRQLAIDRWRRRTSAKRGGTACAVSLSELGDVLAAEGDPIDALEAKRLDQVLDSFLRSLSREARCLFLSRYYYLDPLKEAARACGMSESKAKSMLWRTRKKLRTVLEKEGFVL